MAYSVALLLCFSGDFCLQFPESKCVSLILSGYDSDCPRQATALGAGRASSSRVSTARVTAVPVPVPVRKREAPTRQAVREDQRPVEEPEALRKQEAHASVSAVSASTTSLVSSFTEGFGTLKVTKASSEPRLPTCLAHLGVPSRTPRTPRSPVPKPQGRGPSSPVVAEWEHAQGQRAALYPICAMTPQEAREWGDPKESAKGRWHHDSSLVSAVVFGNPTRPERRRTRPGSVDPGLLEPELPGSVGLAGLPSSHSSEGRRCRTPRSPATRFEEESVSIRSATESDRYTPRARKRVPGLSDSSTVVGDLLFHSPRAQADMEGGVWDGCAGQPSDSRQKQSSKQIATLWDLQGYAGLGSVTLLIQSGM